MNDSIFLPTSAPPRSLCWYGDTIVDWVAGGARFSLDGQKSRASVIIGYRFNRAVSSPDGRYVVLYETLGTAALLLKDGKLIRELHRSYYFADRYEYPIALTTLPSGRTLLAHCPDEYCRLEIEDAESGERLTRRSNKSVDFFHSRLQFSRDGRYLLSAGWVWHPFDAHWVIDVQRALEAPETIETDNVVQGGGWGAETSSAAFAERDRVVLTSPPDFAAAFPEDEPDGAQIGTFSIAERRMVSKVRLSEPAGTLMPVGRFAVGFYKSPKLIDLSTGEVVKRWPHLSTGEQLSSIHGSEMLPPPLALDPERRRFAVGTQKGIEVVQIAE